MSGALGGGIKTITGIGSTAGSTAKLAASLLETTAGAAVKTTGAVVGAV